MLKGLFWNIIYIILDILIYMLTGDALFNNWTEFELIALRASLVMLLSFYILYCADKKQIDLYISMFILMLFTAHFGHIWYMTIFTDQDRIYGFLNLLEHFSEQEIIQACHFSMITIILIISGILLTFSSNYHKQNNIKKVHIRSFNHDKIVGWAFIILFIPFQLVILHLRYQMFYTSGYLASVLSVTQIPGIISTLGGLSSTGMALLLFSYQNYVFKQSLLFIIFIGYFAFFMTIGWRNTAFTNSVILSIIFFSTVKLNKRQRNITLATLIALALIAISASRVIRSGLTLSLSWGTFIEIMPQLLMEFGSALYSVIMSIKTVGSLLPEWHGMGYLAHLLTILPNVFGIGDGLSYYIVEHFLPNTIGRGGSMIAELYCNFSYAGYLFAPIIGMLVGIVAWQFKKGIIESNPFIIAVCYPFMTTSLFWIRHSVSSIYRAFFWNLFALIFITFIIKVAKKCRS